MNASVDKEACNGCELCTKACSEVFKMQSGKAVVNVIVVPDRFESTCKQTAGDCPGGAIHVGEAHGFMLSRNSDNSGSWIAL